MEVAGKVAVVTGASRGLGVSIARALGEAGAKVALAARSAEDLEEVRAKVVSDGIDAVAIPTDVRDASERARLLDETDARLGPVDILVNNAGTEAVGPFDRLDPRSIEHVVDVNLTSALLLSREALPGMLDRERGHIVNMASAAGKIGLPFQSVYSASKFGLVGATAALRAEYDDSPVGISAVCPGFVQDEGMYARFEERGVRAPRRTGTTTPDKVARAVVRAVERDQAEVIVNDVPLRPLGVLAGLFPGLHTTLLKLGGVTEMGRRASQLTHER